MNLIDMLDEVSGEFIDTVVECTGIVWDDFFDAEKESFESSRSVEVGVEKRNKERGRLRAEKNSSEIDSELVNQAQQKIISKEIKRKENITEITRIAKKTLRSLLEPVSNILVDENWKTRFFSIVQDIDDKKMQILWGKILAEEIRRPESFSLRTLEVLKNLNIKEVKLFLIAVSLSCSKRFVIFNNGIEDFEKYGLCSNSILKLQDAQLILPDDMLVNSCKSENGVVKIVFESETIAIKSDLAIELKALFFTEAGRELAQLINMAEKVEHINDTKEDLQNKGFILL